MKKWFKNPSGSPMFTGAQLVRLILPFIAGYIMSLLVGMLDTAMVSTVGESAVSGVSLVDNLMQLVVFSFSAFGTGGAVVAGQYLGSRNADMACRSTEQLLVFAGVVSVSFMVLTYCFRKGLMMLFFGDITPEVAAEFQIYLTITVFSLPGMALFEASMASFRAMGEAKITMYVSFVMNLINVLGNALLIFGFHMGTAGVAWPTLISRWAGAVIGLALLCNVKYPLHLCPGNRFRLMPELLMKILKVAIPGGVENGIFQLGKLIVLSLITGFGTQAIAANAVAVILTNIISVPGWGIFQADLTVLSHCVGAEDYEQAKYYNRLLLLVTGAVIVCWAGIVYLSLPLLLGLFHLSPEAVTLTKSMVQVHIVGACLLWNFAFLIPSSLRAAGDAVYPMVVSILSMWIFRVGLAWIFCRYTSLGAIGIWIAMVIDWLFRAVVYQIHWMRGSWMKKRVI